MKKPLEALIPRLARGAAPATAIATGLVAPLAQAASGDLDPAYGDHGRLGPVSELKGPAWSLETLEGGDSILGGGMTERYCGWYYCWYDVYYEASSFVESVTADGGIDASYDAAEIPGIEVFDIARQADGKVVAVGRRVIGRDRRFNRLAAFRLEAGGALDASFGTDGFVELDNDLLGLPSQAKSVLVDPDGRIVIAGAATGALVVLRLNSDGSIDSSFGSGGLFTEPGHDDSAAGRLARVSSGGYRVTTSDGNACRVLGLTASGAIDQSYGESGYAALAQEPGGAVACHSAAVQADDRLLIAGVAAGQSFAVRLLANGAPDPSFAAAEVAAVMQEASAIAVAPDGRILVGGSGVRGATIMRLQATGELDAIFGDAGQATIDLPSDAGSAPLIHDIAVLADGAALVAGGDYATYPPRPFAVRLLGDGGGDSAGVVSIAPGNRAGFESDEVAVTVRRTGGRTGAVSVTYRTQLNGGGATEGRDYEAASGELHWDDGDAGERSVVIRILSDGGEPEEYESFGLALDEPAGGAGLGTRNASINIQPDGAPAGQFALEVYGSTVPEFGSLQFWLYRNYYADGAVCVNLDTRSGTAMAGEDFVADASVHCWDDQDTEPKLIEIEIVNDDIHEELETFSVELSNPTGGAIIGPRSSATIAIEANDAPVRRSGGGSGSTGYLSLLLLGLAELFRSSRRYLRKRG